MMLQIKLLLFSLVSGNDLDARLDRILAKMKQLEQLKRQKVVRAANQAQLEQQEEHSQVKWQRASQREDQRDDATLASQETANGLAWTRIVLPTPAPPPSMAPTQTPTNLPTAAPPPPTPVALQALNNRLFSIPEMQIRRKQSAPLLPSAASEWAGEQHGGTRSGDCNFATFCGWSHESFSLGNGRVFGSTQKNFAWAVTTARPLFATLSSPPLNDKILVAFNFKLAFAREGDEYSDAHEEQTVLAARRDPAAAAHPDAKLRAAQLMLQQMRDHIACRYCLCPVGCRCSTKGVQCWEKDSDKECSQPLWQTIWHHAGSPSASGQAWQRKSVVLPRPVEAVYGGHAVSRLRFVASTKAHSSNIDLRLAHIQVYPQSAPTATEGTPTSQPTLCLDRFRC